MTSTVYFIYCTHDVSDEGRAFCVDPGSHKSAVPCPYACSIDEEPGMIGLEVKTGMRFYLPKPFAMAESQNHKNETRMTLHVGYGPYWMMSQNIATMDESLFINQKLGNVIIPNKKNYSNLGYDKARNIN